MYVCDVIVCVQVLREEMVTAPESMKSGFQTAAEWPRMRVELEFISGTIWACTISILIAAFSIVLFTGNCYLAMFATFIIMSIVACVLGFFVLAGWTLGAIEAISVAILVGLSVDYVLHIGHSYNHSSSMDRKNRTKAALYSIGSSVLAASITTIGSTMILVFCQIQIFVVFGIIVAVTSFCSIVFSIGTFVALIYTWGPEDESGNLFACCKCCQHHYLNPASSRNLLVHKKKKRKRNKKKKKRKHRKAKRQKRARVNRRQDSMEIQSPKDIEMKSLKLQV